jgi:hypothetical protein
VLFRIILHEVVQERVLDVESERKKKQTKEAYAYGAVTHWSLVSILSACI